MPITDIKFTNNARTLLSTGSLADDDTSVSVDDGSVFPALSSGHYFYATLERASDSTTREIVKVTARSGNNLTIVRAQDNTSATTFSADDIIELRLTAKAIEDIRDAVSPTLTQEQVEDYVGGMLDGTETFIDVSYDDTDGNIDFVVPVKDEDNMASDSATHLATQQSVKAYVDTQVGTNSITTYKYTATAGQTTFSGNDNASNSLLYSVGNLLVVLNGATLINGTDYTASNTTSVVLTDAATVGDELIIYAFAAFTASTQVLTLFKYSATAGQTTFSGSDSASQTLAYTAGMIVVTLNGVVLDTSDYTASNGTSVVLGSAASVSDELNIIAFAPFNVSNVTTASADFAIGDDLSFTSDGAVINMGADSDVTMTHVHNKGVQFNTMPITPNPCFFARVGSNQTVSSGVVSKATLDTEDFDVGGYFDSSTNYRFTPLIAGYYQFNLQLYDLSNTDVYDLIVYLYKNGAQTMVAGRARMIGLTNDDLYATVVTASGILHANGVDDYFELYFRGVSEDSGNIIAGADWTNMNGVLVSRTG